MVLDRLEPNGKKSEPQRDRCGVSGQPLRLRKSDGRGADRLDRVGRGARLVGILDAQQEIIAAEHGLGQTLAYLQSTFNIHGVMGLLFLLSILGMTVTQSMTWLEKALLKWQ